MYDEEDNNNCQSLLYLKINDDSQFPRLQARQRSANI
jgi:hypothetical protein